MSGRDGVLDCVIVGGGPAGLTAATYLGRFLRSVLIVDDGGSRMKTIPLSRNTPGFPDGIAGEDLHARMTAQALKYGAEFSGGLATHIERRDGLFEVTTPGGVRTARTVLLATGVKLDAPEIDRLEDGLARGAIRYCPICDGFEAAARKVAVLGGRRNSLNEAVFLRTYTADVSFVPARGGPLISSDEAAEARRCGVRITSRADSLRLTPEGVSVTYDSGDEETFEIVYPCLGSAPQTQLIEELGVELGESGGVVTDRHQRSSVAGLYVAGDVLDGLDQIASACGQAAIAATAIHNDLPPHARSRSRRIEISEA